MDLSNQKIKKLNKDDIFCAEGDLDLDMFIIKSGKLLVCIRKGTEVTPLAYLESGDYIGELSFFDHLPRSADIVALEDTELYEISQEQISHLFPNWVNTLCRYMSTRLRNLDDVVRKHGIKRKNIGQVKPLSIEEQRHYYSIIQNYKGSQ